MSYYLIVLKPFSASHLPLSWCCQTHERKYSAWCSAVHDPADLQPCGYPHSARSAGWRWCASDYVQSALSAGYIFSESY